MSPPPLFRPPIVIAHRGASGERPEHTLAAYRLAIEQGADFIEPDLVPTRDGVLIARHENELSGTTDVASKPEFADRRTRKHIDGEGVDGWFSEDFTLAEIRTLRARERLPELRPANCAWDGKETIPTLADILQLVRDAEAAGRRVGIYPETKHPTYFLHEGRHLDGSPIALDIGAMLLDELQRKGFTDPARIFIQSFELANLLDLRQRQMPACGLDLPLIFLFGTLREAPPQDASSQPYDFPFHASDDGAARYGSLAALLPERKRTDLGYAHLARPNVLAALARAGIAGVGLRKSALLPARWPGPISSLLTDARAAGLEVHPYTLRREPVFLSPDHPGSTHRMEDEIASLLDHGATGFFTDHPDRGVAARDGAIRSESTSEEP